MYAPLLETSWPDAATAVGFFAMVTIVAAVALWQGLASWQARKSAAREDAYRKLAEESLSAQTRLAVQQQRLADDLTVMNERVAGIEKLLKDVG